MTGWNPSMRSTESIAAVQAYMDRRYADEDHDCFDPHDPEFLACLDKADLISRYTLLVDQSSRKLVEMREHYDHETAALRRTVTKAGTWWTHCRRLKRQGRKMVALDHDSLTIHTNSED